MTVVVDFSPFDNGMLRIKMVLKTEIHQINDHNDVVVKRERIKHVPLLTLYCKRIEAHKTFEEFKKNHDELLRLYNVSATFECIEHLV